jgi:hypothetical protein
VSAPGSLADRPADRRGSVRHHCNVKLLAGREPAIAAIHNISREGLGFFLSHYMEVGVALPVELLNLPGSFWHLKAVRVVHATPQQEGTWLIGSAFLTPLTDTELQDFLNQEGQTPVGET